MSGRSTQVDNESAENARTGDVEPGRPRPGNRPAALVSNSGVPREVGPAPKLAKGSGQSIEGAAAGGTDGGADAHAPRMFRHSVRVPYAHVDKMGVVYYANYFVYFEMARSEMLREIGLPYTELETRGVMLPVVEACCEYRLPARYDDLLEIATRCRHGTGVRLKIEYDVTRNGDAIASGYTHHVCMSSGGKVMRPIPELKRLFAPGTMEKIDRSRPQ